MAGDCIFCKIANKEIPAEIVYEDEQVMAFTDLNPQAPTHVLVIPKAHRENLLALTEADRDLAGALLLKGAEIARRLGVAEPGFRLVANCGADGGQTVDHLHLHLLGGRSLTWPPG